MRYLAFVPYVIILIGVALSFLGLVPAIAGWLVSAVGVLIGLGIAVALRFTGNSWLLVLVAVAPLLAAIPMVISGLRYPPINDVTTNTEHPSVFVAAHKAPANIGRDMSFPQDNGPIVREAYPNVQPLVLNEPLTTAFQQVENAAAGLDGWVITHRDVDARILEAEVASSLFRFVDDVVITVTGQDGEARIDMRSKSRDGRGDVGANAKRIQSFLDALRDK